MFALSRSFGGDFDPTLGSRKRCKAELSVQRSNEHLHLLSCSSGCLTVRQISR